MSRILPGLFTIVLFQSWIAGALFLINGRTKRSAYLIGLFLFAYSAGSIPWLLKSLGLLDTFPQLQHLPIGFFFLVVPLFYLHALTLTGVYRRNDLLHLLPGVLESLILFTVFAVGDQARTWLYVDHRSWIEGLYVFVWPLYSIAYAGLTFWLTIPGRLVGATGDPKAYEKRLSWLQVTAVILMISYAVELLTAFTTVFSSYGASVLYLNIALTIFVIYWVSISGFRQEELVFGFMDFRRREPVAAAPGDEEQYQSLVRLITERALYTDKELNLITLAEASGLHPKQLSRLVNTYSGKNVSQFINRFRIEEAQRILAEGSLDYLNLSGLAERVGFRSRSSFFSAFRQVTGTTPAEFKKTVSGE